MLNIDTEKPSDRCANNRNSPNHKRRSDKSPVLSGLGGGPSAFLRRMSVHESEQLCAVGLHSQADITSSPGTALGVVGEIDL